MKNSRQSIVVGLSGGLDSAVALLLLKKQGYQPIGLTLRYSGWSGKENVYSNQQSIRLAKKFCRQLKVPHYTLDCRQTFKKKVIGYFISLLKNKKTPNPCVVCNQQLKIQKLIEFAQKKRADYVATGHYARVRKVKKEHQLLRGKDKEKDQSYFLCLLNQLQLAKIIFPLGNLTKKEVYQLAKRESLNFLTRRKQSQDLCFISQKLMPLFLEKEIGLQPGQIVDKEGKVLGQHQGLHFYTIGQRRGIKLSGGPWWVIGFDKGRNRLVVTNKKNDPLLFRREIRLTDYHLISGQAPRRTIKVEARTRFNQRLAAAKLYLPAKGKLKLIFNKPQKAVTPGQWAVFYQKEVCLGGGMIL